MDEAKNGDRLDQLVREAAEGAQFEFNPSAWSAMEQKLDAPKKGFFWWKLGGSLGLLAVIILLIIYIPSGTGESELASNTSTSEENVSGSDGLEKGNQEELTAKTTESDLANEKNVAPQNTREQETAGSNQAVTITPELESNAIEKNDVNSEALNTTGAAVKPEDPTSKATVNEEVKASISSSSERVVQSTVEPSSTREGNVSKNSTVKDETSSTSSETTYFDASQPINLFDSTGTESAGPYGVGVETITPRWKPSVFLFDLSLKPMTLDTSLYQTADLDSLQTFKKWSFGVLVSLDLSATGFDNFTNPGTMIGLMAEYRLSNKWSLQSGFNYSVKNYRALGDEYDTSTWPGGRSDNLVSALARCLVIDIPINVRRYFSAKEENQWFVSTGVSTYLMLREDYDYEYATQNPNWSPTGQVRGENNHFLGVANFSVGYETPINGKLGLAVEPFMKLPLTGIGQGQVKFLSFGANVAIKLR